MQADLSREPGRMCIPPQLVYPHQAPEILIQESLRRAYHDSLRDTKHLHIVFLMAWI